MTTIYLNNKQLTSSIKSFVNSLSLDHLDPTDTINSIDLRYVEDYSDIESELNCVDEYSQFNQEIIYYSKAIQYLSDNDPSLRDSISLAIEQGYELDSITSELLASILATDLAVQEWYKVKDLILKEFDDFTVLDTSCVLECNLDGLQFIVDTINDSGTEWLPCIISEDSETITVLKLHLDETESIHLDEILECLESFTLIIQE